VNDIACQVPSGDLAGNTSFEVEGSMHPPLHFVSVARVHARRGATSDLRPQSRAQWSLTQCQSTRLYDNRCWAYSHGCRRRSFDPSGLRLASSCISHNVWTKSASHFLLACSGIELEASSSEPHLALALGFADKLSGEADTRGEVRIAFHLQYNVVDNVVHGCWWRQELRK
jgi:hypothetical protein